MNLCEMHSTSEDIDGWYYADDFTTNNTWLSKHSTGNYVRRRLWQREIKKIE